jgi:general secretion pathway protein F
MGAFEYTALDAAGREQTGVLEGDTPKHVRQALRERQLLPVTVTAVAERESRSARRFTLARRGVSASDLALFTRQLATLVRAGLPLEEALLAVSQQTEKARIQSIIIGVRSRVMEGHTLADGLTAFPRVFPEIYRATVAAGEQSGHLDNVLERLADYTENREVMRQKIIGALLYPIVLSVVCFFVVGLLMVYVVPKVLQVFEASRTQLPVMTRLLVGTSDFLRTWGIWLVLAIGAGAFLFERSLANLDNRRRFHHFQLRLPIVGRVVRGFNAARFTRTFSILSASAVPVLEAMRIAGDVVNNVPMHEAVSQAAARVREGAPIGRSLAVSRLFPPMTIHLISSGESSGELDQMLERAAVSQERELDGILTALVGLLGPAMIVLMGAFVMGIVFAMLLPIFEMNTLIR